MSQFAEHAFGPGDSVALSSGGHGLTVIDVGKHTGLIFCQWATPNGFTEQAFPAAALVLDPRSHFHEP